MCVLRLYSPAFTFATWAGVRLAGTNSDLVAGVFLALSAMAVVVAERERHRLVHRRRARYRRRRTDR